MSARVARSLYRALLRASGRLTAPGPARLPPPLHLEDIATRYGRGSYTAAPPPAEVQAAYFGRLPIADLSPALPDALSRADLRALVRRGFEKARAGDVPGLTLDDGLAYLSTLNRLASTAGSHSVTQTEHGSSAVTVEMTTRYCGLLPTAVLAQAQHFPFAYRLRITNTGSRVLQLVARGWRFSGDDGSVTVVPRGSAGVVGHSPVLEPGQAFEYVSGTQLTCPSGHVTGCFTMVVDGTEERFDCAVGETALIGPEVREGGADAAAYGGAGADKTT